MVTFSSPLIKGRLIKRYKRFLADVELPNGEVVVAHCVNTGSMKSCAHPDATVYLTTHNNPKRKLKYTWELTEVDGGYICVNTSLPNAIVEDAWRENLIPELSGYSQGKREVKYGDKSRIDLLLTEEGRPPCYVEVKNVTLCEGDVLRFPDAKSERAKKHVTELVKLHQETGARVVMLFMINRPEGHTVGLAHAIDPAYGEAVKQALPQGLEILCYRTHISLDGITIKESVPFDPNV